MVCVVWGCESRKQDLSPREQEGEKVKDDQLLIVLTAGTIAGGMIGKTSDKQIPTRAVALAREIVREMILTTPMEPENNV